MVRLSEILDQVENGHSELGFIIYEAICHHCLKGSDASKEDDFFVGLSPERILLNDDWGKHIDRIEIDRTIIQPIPCAYYPPEYINGEPWDSSCTVFSLCAIIYRIYNCCLPYVDNPNEDLDLLLSKERVENLSGERIYPLHLSCFPEDLQAFLKKGLSLDKSSRYQTLAESWEDYKKIDINDFLYITSDSPIYDIEFYRKAESMRDALRERNEKIRQNRKDS